MRGPRSTGKARKQRRTASTRPLRRRARASTLAGVAGAGMGKGAKQKVERGAGRASLRAERSHIRLKGFARRPARAASGRALPPPPMITPPRPAVRSPPRAAEGSQRWRFDGSSAARARAVDARANQRQSADPHKIHAFCSLALASTQGRCTTATQLCPAGRRRSTEAALRLSPRAFESAPKTTDVSAMITATVVSSQRKKRQLQPWPFLCA